jgi:hypothetical protein
LGSARLVNVGRATAGVIVGKSVHGRFGISGVELCDNYHTLRLWCGTALVRCACRGMASLRPDWFSGSAQ